MSQVVSTQSIVVSSNPGHSNEREIGYWRITEHANKEVIAVFDTVLGKLSEYGDLHPDFDLHVFLSREYPEHKKFQGLHRHKLSEIS